MAMPAQVGNNAGRHVKRGPGQKSQDVKSVAHQAIRSCFETMETRTGSLPHPGGDSIARHS